jgi:hypothetical protein
MRRGLALSIAVVMLGVACSTEDQDDGATPATTTTTTASATSGVHLNELQMIGTHNSYHVAPEAKLFEAEKAVAASLGEDAGGLGDINSLAYTHQPWTDQLESGIRSFELDAYADPEGGLYANPLAPEFLGITDTPLPTGMDEPGFKVLHIADVDFISTCPTLIGCMTELRTWSDAHPDHVPLVINLELKADGLPASLNATVPAPIDAAALDAVDAEIRSVFDEDRLLTPDDVRGDAATLRDAVTATGWPEVDDVRGQVMFFLDNGGELHDEYVAGHPSLEGRVLFTSAAEDGDDDQAVVKVNDPKEAPRITQLVKDGFFVRTRSDADLVEATANDTTNREITFGSGAQIVSTDFPVAEPASNGYVVKFGDGLQVRCNPVATGTCARGALEP